MQSTNRALPNVMVHGTFDVANYGDLLFPHLLGFGLHPVAHRLTAVAPRGGTPGWADTVVPQSVSCARMLAADLHVVGGGNIIQPGDTPLAEYRDIEGGSAGAYASLWCDVASQAARTGAKLAWNAPGVPHLLAEVEGAAAALACCDVLAVRDASSAAHLGPTAKPVIVPDTALDIARMWPAQTLDTAATAAFARHGLPRPTRWVALHANARYLDGDAAATAAKLTALAHRLDAVPVLLALGPCQGDDTLARAIGAHLPPGSLVLDRPAGLREIAGLIAHAEAYAGSSLHGLITALSYGRPALVVAGGPLAKFAGFLEHVAMPARHLANWSAAVQAESVLLQPLDIAALASVARAQDKIAGHWQRLRTLLTGPASPDAVAARQRLAAQRPPGPAATPPAASAPAAGPELGTPCGICGGTTFRRVASPPDRLGDGAVCAGCGSSARHRALRTVLEAFRTPDWRGWQCLRLGETGRIAAAGWFAACVQAPEPGAQYDLILAVDALEAAADPARAIAEWRSLLRPGGLMLLSMRTVPGRATSLDWGFPRGDRNGEYRMFGADITASLSVWLPGAAILEVRAADPVTAVRAVAYAVAAEAGALTPLRSTDLDTRLLSA